MADEFAAYRSIIKNLRRMDHVSFPAALARCRLGDENARRLISEASLHLAHRIATEWLPARRAENIADMLEEANAALWHAIEDFTGWRLDAFESFVTQRIRDRLRRTSQNR